MVLAFPQGLAREDQGRSPPPRCLAWQPHQPGARRRLLQLHPPYGRPQLASSLTDCIEFSGKPPHPQELVPLLSFHSCAARLRLAAMRHPIFASPGPIWVGVSIVVRVFHLARQKTQKIYFGELGRISVRHLGLSCLLLSRSIWNETNHVFGCNCFRDFSFLCSFILKLLRMNILCHLEPVLSRASSWETPRR